jgi:hypothetical protein
MAKLNKTYQEVKIIFNYEYTIILSCIQRHLTTFCSSLMAAFLGKSTGVVCVLELKILEIAS